MDVNVSRVILHCTMGKSDEQGSEIFFFYPRSHSHLTVKYLYHTRTLSTAYSQPLHLEGG